MNFRLSIGIFAPLILLGALHCGGSSETGGAETACVPGRSVACSGAQGCDGHQVCRKDGSGFDLCVCAGDETFPSRGPTSGLPGAACQDDRDCRAGLTCLTADSTNLEGEGPSAGLCLADCARDPSVCDSLYPDTQCVLLDQGETPESADDDAFCMPSCKVGDPAPNDEKCRGRVDLVCAEETAGTGLGYCRPACRADLDCGERYCNLATGLCADAPASGDEIGAACNPAAPRCAGGCVEHGSSYAECSGVCQLNTPGCGQLPSSKPPYDYWCYLDPSRAGGEGDLGYCTRTCDCDADCGRPDAVCDAEGELAKETGRRGVCASKVYGSGEARPGIPCE